MLSLSVPFGYLNPVGPDFVCVSLGVLTILVTVLLVVTYVDLHTQGLGSLVDLDYSVYGTSEFETDVFSLLTFVIVGSGESLLASTRQEIKDTNDLTLKERQCERDRDLTQKRHNQPEHCRSRLRVECQDGLRNVVQPGF